MIYVLLYMHVYEACMIYDFYVSDTQQKSVNI